MKQGRVIINRNICDNAPECSGIEVCPNGALYWNEEAKTIAYNAEKCVDCGSCADPVAGGCPVGAILWGYDDEDYDKKKQDVEEDTRTLKQLEVERYGAVPIVPVLEFEEIENVINDEDNQYVLIEFFSDDSINCLIHSIRVEDITALFDSPVIYKKVQVSSCEDCKPLCKAENLPALAIFKNGNLISVISGYYENDTDSSKEFFAKIQNSIQ